jgi:hypothetical protein
MQHFENILEDIVGTKLAKLARGLLVVYELVDFAPGPGPIPAVPLAVDFRQQVEALLDPGEIPHWGENSPF